MTGDLFGEELAVSLSFWVRPSGSNENGLQLAETDNHVAPSNPFIRTRALEPEIVQSAVGRSAGRLLAANGVCVYVVCRGHPFGSWGWFKGRFKGTQEDHQNIGASYFDTYPNSRLKVACASFLSYHSCK